MTVPAIANTMDGVDIKLPIFNGNWLEDLEQHWFVLKMYGMYDRSKMRISRL